MENRKNDFAHGQLHALICFTQAFIAAQPNNSAIESALVGAELLVESLVVPASVPDAFLDGSRDVIHRLRAARERFPAPD